MPFWFILIAASIGYMLDRLITLIWQLFVISALYGINDIATQVEISRPDHVVIVLIVPALITVLSGGVAGYIAALDPMIAGALVGGIGLFSMLGDDMSLYGSLGPYAIAGQCIATVLAAFVARYGAKRRLQKTPPQE